MGFMGKNIRRVILETAGTVGEKIINVIIWKI
jgi:hypothetical protein